MDCVGRLTKGDRIDGILVVVDWTSTMMHFIPCLMIINAHRLAESILRVVVQLHGLPATIVSDRGLQFASVFRGMLCIHFVIEQKMSTAFHPETGAQTELMNGGVKQYVQDVVNHQFDNLS